jgi:hypothetical protein
VARENVEVVRRSVEPLEQRRRRGARRDLLDDAELEPAPGFIEGGRLSGHEGIRHFFERLHEAWKPGDTSPCGNSARRVTR